MMPLHQHAYKLPLGSPWDQLLHVTRMPYVKEVCNGDMPCSAQASMPVSATLHPILIMAEALRTWWWPACGVQEPGGTTQSLPGVGRPWGGWRCVGRRRECGGCLVSGCLSWHLNLSLNCSQQPLAPGYVGGPAAHGTTTFKGFQALQSADKHHLSGLLLSPTVQASSHWA